jgi:DNA modification methylase
MAEMLLVQADARALPLADESVHCCVTSPPYWGLRDYGEAAQLGAEATPDAYVAALVAVFREVHRVLRDDGTLWLNLGDSYAGSWGNQGRKAERGTQRPIHGPMLTPVHDGRYPNKGSQTGRCPAGLKPKDLCGIPWRVALALQADGWYLRAAIIWHKPNPMPESVRDRPTRAHETVFLLSKRARYFYDADAIREAHLTGDRNGDRRSYAPGSASSMQDGEHQEMRGSFAGLPLNPAGRNARDCWTIATQAFRGAHFATMPQALAARCLLAGTSAAGCCAACGAPWRRLVDRYRTHNGRRTDTLGAWRTTDRDAPSGAQGDGHWRYASVRHTTGWAPTCACAAGAPVPAIVLDPFAGAGTVPLTARAHGRHGLGLDLSAPYLHLAAARRAAAVRQAA